MTDLEQKLSERLITLEQEKGRIEQENELLRQKIELLTKKLFGAKSEKVIGEQTPCLEGLDDPSNELKEVEPERLSSQEVADYMEDNGVATAPKKKRQVKSLVDLPIVEVIIDPDPVKEKPADWRLIGQEQSDQIEYSPARFHILRTIRRKYVSIAHPDKAPVIAPLVKLQDRCIAGPGLIAAVVTAKYNDHLPLYRQEDIFKRRFGVEIPRQSLCRWVELASNSLTLINAELEKKVFSSDYIQVDETPIRYLAPGNGKTKIGYIWAIRSGVGGEIIFLWRTSRSMNALSEIIPKEYKGVIQSDDYQVYQSYAAKNPGVKSAGCWAHTRRKFIEALENGKLVDAKWVIDEIRKLYAIEDELRNDAAGEQARAKVRVERSKPIVASLFEQLSRWQEEKKYLPKSSMGMAIHYTLDNRKQLEVFLEEGRVEIDNNLLENAIRPTAVGKKNWLFFGAADAGHRSAVIFTIITNCLGHNVNTYDYFRDVLARIPLMTNQQVPELLPANWKPSARSLPEPGQKPE